MFGLIIFDCDGTLVDTESLYAQITCGLLHDNGLRDYTPESCMAEFQGLSWLDIRASLEARHKMKLCDDIIERYVLKSREMMKTDLRVIEGVPEVVAAVSKTHKICVGSNGERENVFQSIDSSGLQAYFPRDRIYTKDQVEKAKPAPDLFLYAAEEMGVQPNRCLVIEDSAAGVKAGVAAGMHVIGFTGSNHNQIETEAKLKNAGAHTIMHEFIHISDWLKA